MGVEDMTRPKRPATYWPSHSLCVLVPACNHEDSLEATVDRLMQALSITIEDFELIIADDGSVDRTGQIAERLAAAIPQVRAFHNPRPMGLGACYIRGTQEARKAHFVYVPADNTWPQRSFLELFGQLGKADIITSYSSNPGVMPFGRRLISKAYTRLLNALFGHHMRYFNGLTIYPREFLRATTITSRGFGFQAEILLKALEAGLSYVEVAIPIDPRTIGAARVLTASNIVSAASMVTRLYAEVRRERGASRLAAQIGNAEVPRRPGTPLNVIVTGASSGIGEALAKALARDGHTLYICARRGDQLERVAAGHPLVHAQVCDVADERQVQDFVAWVKDHTPYVDAVVNCAGWFGAIGPLPTTDSEEWFTVVRVNVFGTYLMTKYALPLLGGSERPRIVNFAGGGAFGAFKNYSAYAASKAAIVRLTECLAAELADDGIAVNAIAPGFVATEFHRATLAAGPEKAGELHFHRTKAILDGRGVPIDVPVDCVRFLLSDDANGLTGKTISANFDPWRSGAFRRYVREITESELYTMRRVNIVNLPHGRLRTMLADASARQERW